MRGFFLICFFFSLLASSLSANNYRDSIDVLHYDLHIDIVNLNNAFLEGKALLEMNMLFEGTSFALDLSKLLVDSVQVGSQSVIFSQNDTSLRIDYGYALGDTLLVHVFYQGTPKIDPQWGGFFFQDGFAYNIGVGMGSYPHGIGRFWYPCIDSFTDRATYDYYLKSSPGYMAVGGGLLVNEWDDEGYRVYHWKLSQTIPTYLSSIAYGSFVRIDSLYKGLNEIPVSLYAAKADSLKMVNTFDQIHETTAAFEKRFGPYRWGRIGFVAIPFNQGAMEHATNIAFPQNALSGSLSDKTLAAHELSHHWFGNLVTCASSYEMWLNEGWASYCEIIFKEEVISAESAQNQIVSNHNSVVKKVHITDGDHFPLNQLPPHVTYGKHAYDKGADIVHTLRNYMGDTSFFKAVSYYLDKFAYQEVASQDLCDALTESSGESLQPFFDNWVYQAGFPHYSIDSFTYEKLLESDYTVSVALRQKLKARAIYSVKNRIELTLLDENWNFVPYMVEFDGPTQEISLESSIEPKAILVDMHSKFGDASVDEKQIINNVGYAYFNACDFKIRVLDIQDSAFIQCTQHLVSADNFSDLENGVRLSNYYYWTLQGILPERFEAKGNVFYNFPSNTNPDDGYEAVETDTVVLLHRENAADKWQIVTYGSSAKAPIGELDNFEVRLGDYAVGIWDGSSLNGLRQNFIENKIKCFPIPVDNCCNLTFEDDFSGKVEVYNQVGCKILIQDYLSVNHIALNTNAWDVGTYLVKVDGKYSEVFRIIKNR